MAMDHWTPGSYDYIITAPPPLSSPLPEQCSLLQQLRGCDSHGHLLHLDLIRVCGCGGARYPGTADVIFHDDILYLSTASVTVVSLEDCGTALNVVTPGTTTTTVSIVDSVTVVMP